jgi:glycosyltransferase involved in cell wall biosynthesis
MGRKLISLLITPMTGNGGDRVVINLARAFVRLGYRVDLVVTDVSDYHLKAVQSLHDVRTVKLSQCVRPLIYVRKLFKLKHYLIKNRPFVLLANGDYVGLANFAQILAQTSTPVIQIVHVHISRYFSEKSRLVAAAKKVMIRIFYPLSSAIVAVSHGVAKDVANMAHLPIRKVNVIYNPVVTEELMRMSRADISHPWFQDGETPVILGAGRLMYQKDFGTLIKAFAKVRSEQPCRLAIIGGEAVEQEYLESLIKEFKLEQDVQLMGFADNPYAYMAKASVFALSSRYEGFGNVLVEAMATGTPVVSTDCESGPAEILENGKYGHLSPVGDADQLAKSIAETLRNPLAASLLKRQAQYFTDFSIAKQYVELIESLNCLVVQKSSKMASSTSRRE